MKVFCVPEVFTYDAWKKGLAEQGHLITSFNHTWHSSALDQNLHLWTAAHHNWFLTGWDKNPATKRTCGGKTVRQI